MLIELVRKAVFSTRSSFKPSVIQHGRCHAEFIPLILDRRSQWYM